jgi:hypothetical protein
MDELCRVHFILAQGQSNNGGEAGILRDYDMDCETGNYIPGVIVEQEVAEFFEWFQKELVIRQSIAEDSPEKAISFAAEAYQKLVSIHPFSDGNGRVTRFVMDYALIRLGFPPALIAKEDTSVAVFADLPDEDSHNVHPLQCALVVAKGVLASYKRILGD